MATGPREKQRLIEANSSSWKLYATKILKSHNSANFPQPPQQFSTDDDPSSPPPPPKSFDTVASDDSSSHTHGTGNSLPGYVKFDNKVRISLNNGSKSVIRELKRKLVSELDKVRSLKRRLEDAEIHYNGYNEVNMMGSGGGNCNNRVGTLSKVNSEVSYVGPTNSRPLAVSVDDNSNHFDYGGIGEKVDRERKTSKVNQHHKNPDSGVGKEKILNAVNTKKLKPGSGGKMGSKGKVTEFGSRMVRNSKEIFKKCGVLLEKLMKHQYGWVFNKPVDVKKLKLHDYYTIIKHPMDLGTVTSRLKKNWYKSPKEFAEDVRLTFNNAMTYNEKGQDVHIMADALLKLFEEKWTAIKAGYNFDESFDMGNDANLPTPTSKFAPAPPIPAPVYAPPQKKPSEKRISDKPGPGTKTVRSNIKGTKIATDEGKTPISKKPEEKKPQRREMTFEQKQKLSTNLLSLPSEKLDSVVQIIRKRNPGLCQQEDEIEVDIDSFDSETLWELDRLVTDHLKGSSKNRRNGVPVLQRRDEVGHDIQETNLTSSAAERIEESQAVEKVVSRSPMVREEQGNDSRSSSSGSTSYDSGSSSSDSDSNSSSHYCSDTGR